MWKRPYQRSDYYKWLKNGKCLLRKIDDAILKEHILEIHQSCKMYGYPRMKIALRDRGKEVYRLMWGNLRYISYA